MTSLNTTQTSTSTISVPSMTYSTQSLLGGKARVSFLLILFLLFGAPGSTEAPLHNPETLEVTTGPFRSKASTLSYFSDLVQTSINYLLHLPSGQTNHRPNYSYCLSSFQHPLPPGLGNYTSDAASLFPPPTPLSVW